MGVSWRQEWEMGSRVHSMRLGRGISERKSLLRETAVESSFDKRRVAPGRVERVEQCRLFGRAPSRKAREGAHPQLFHSMFSHRPGFPVKVAHPSIDSQVSQNDGLVHGV